MLAKVPPKRADGSSSFSALVDYATERDEEKETQTDELNPGPVSYTHLTLPTKA